MPRKFKDNVVALGGDDADVQLLQDVDSDQEMRTASHSQDDRKMQKELKKFMKDLKFSGAADVDMADSTPSKGKQGKEKSKKKSDEKDKATKKRSSTTEVTQAKPKDIAKTKERDAPSKKRSEKKFAESQPKPAPKAAESTLQPVATESKPTASSSKAGYIIGPASAWFNAIPDLPESSKPVAEPTADFVASRSSRAAELLAQDVSRFEAQSSTSSGADAQFLSRVLSGGTLSDRLSALTLLAQGSPVHNASALEQLRGLAKKKSRDQSLKAVRAIVDWWIGGGAPDRKLKYFRDQPLNHREVTDAHLVVWYFEDWLKKYFFGILQILEALSMDPLPYVRIQACTFIFQLLRDKAEQEQNLLRLLVKKLGDSDRPVASRVSYHLMQLVQTHPQMKNIIIGEVSASIFGGSGEPKGKYYAVITFNQMVLNAKESAVANRLMDLYFKIFREMLGEGQPEAEEPPAAEQPEEDERPKRRRRKPNVQGKKGQKKGDDDDFSTLEEADSKMISAILTGINRALPFASLEDSSFVQHINTVFRITHEATFNISVQALMLIDHIVSSRAIPSGADLSNRFYRTLYGALLDPRLPASGSKHALFLTLLFRSIRRDSESARVCAFVKRLLQVISGPVSAPGFGCAALVMLGKLCQQRPEIRKMITDAPSKSADQTAYEPGKREPLYAHADTACLWELVPLLNHYHPSVALHAQQLRDGVRLTGAADVGLYTLASFLDRFVLKNPKKKSSSRGASAMQPDATKNDIKEDLDDEALGKLAESQVAPEQVFYHRFVKLKDERERKIASTKRGKKKAQDGSEKEDTSEGSEGEGSDLDEDEVWQAMKATAPGQDLNDDDVDIDDDSDLDMPSDSDDDDDDDNSIDDSLSDADNAASDSDAAAGNLGKDGSEDDELDFLEDDDDVMEDDALIDLDELEADGNVEEEEEWGGIEPVAGGKKRKRGDADESATKRRRRLRDLPIFATFEDYQKMIDDTPEDNI